MADHTSDDHEVLNVRVFAVPRARLFEAWTDPAQLARWWGPKGFRNSFEAFEPSPGGHWRYVMHGPDGADYPNHSVFVELLPNERIVFDHLGDHLYRLTASFADAPGGTELRFHMRFEKAHDAALRGFILGANEQNLDRLQAVLDGTA
nr:SRPBCC family protein [Rivibacter subsaxonicus]